jgi:hypothetical protein
VFDLDGDGRDEALSWSRTLDYEGAPVTGFLSLYSDLERCRVE